MSKILFSIIVLIVSLTILEASFAIYYQSKGKLLSPYETAIKKQGVTAKKEPLERRVFIFGDKAALGEPYYLDFTASSYLRRLLELSGHSNVKAVNMAVSRGNSFLSREYARLLLKYKADAVIYFGGSNETADSSYIVRDVPLYLWDLKLTAHSYFYQWLSARIHRLKASINRRFKRPVFHLKDQKAAIWVESDYYLRKKESYLEDPSLVKAREMKAMQDFETNLNAFHRTLKKKISFLFVSNLPGDSVKSSVLKKVAETNRLLLIDLQNTFEKFSAGHTVSQNLFLDESRPNQTGHKVIASRFMQALCESKFIVCEPSKDWRDWYEKLFNTQFEIILSEQRLKKTRRKSGFKLIAIGDSLTAGSIGGPDTSPYSPYTDVLKNRHKDWLVVNKGVTGQRSLQILARFTKDVLREDPDVVVIWAGQNDLNIYIPPDRVIKNLQIMYEMSIKHHILPVLMTVPLYPSAGDRVENISKVNAWIKNYAKERHLPLFILNKIDSDDDIHPTAENYLRIGKHMNTLIESILTGEPSR